MGPNDAERGVGEQPTGVLIFVARKDFGEFREREIRVGAGIQTTWHDSCFVNVDLFVFS